MRRLITLAAAAMTVLLIAAGPAAARKIDGAATGGSPLSAALSAANEVPPADSNATGSIDLTLNQGQGEICWTMDLDGVEAPTRAHIHRGVAGMNGGVEVFFFDQVIDPGSDVVLTGCTNVERGLIKEIRQNPSGFYVNVHNDEFPGGIVRGQLERP